MRDIFDRIIENKGPLGKWASQAEGYFVFPKLEGPISNRMKFQGKEVITWSINDYLGLANLPEIKKVDGDAAAEYGAAYPMGARMMSGHTEFHEQLEQECAAFVHKEAAYLLNFGYQGFMSVIDALVTKDDIIRWHTNPKHLGGRGWNRPGYSDIIYLDGELINIIPFNQDGDVDGDVLTNVIYYLEWLDKKPSGKM